MAVSAPIFLRAADEAAAKAALYPFVDGEGTWRADLGHAGCLDIIGGIIDTPAVYDTETDEVLQPATWLPGWHANFSIGNPGDPRSAEVAAIVQASGLVIAPPANPVRVPAGYVVPEAEGPEEEGAG